MFMSLVSGSSLINHLSPLHSGMFAFLSQGPLGELLAPVKAPHQQLHQAIEEHRHDKANQLLQEGVYFNAPDAGRGDALPIHTACQAGNQTMIDKLMEMGADVRSATDRHGNGTLHAAAKGGKLETVKFLLAHGLDVSRRNAYRQTAYDVAESHIVRQFLLPLQLRAEPEPAAGSLAAVHNPDVIRDYSNLPPPPTASSYSAPPPPASLHGMSSSGTHLPQASKPAPKVDRPIVADGFHCSVGNPELAAKYGHIKTDIPMAPPPSASGLPARTCAGTGEGGEEGQRGPPRPAANPTQYSAFAAYGGRPPPRYVTYNANDNTSAPFIHPAGPPPPVQQPPGPPHWQQMHHQQSGGLLTHTGRNASSPPQTASPFSNESFQQAPSPAVPSGSTPSSSATSSPVPPAGYRASPLPPPPPLTTLQPPKLPSSMIYPSQHQQPQQHQAARPSCTSNIPTLPAANSISVFRPVADNGEDAVSLDQT